MSDCLDAEDKLRLRSAIILAERSSNFSSIWGVRTRPLMKSNHCTLESSILRRSSIFVTKSTSPFKRFPP
jgi:hypothetical protein